MGKQRRSSDGEFNFRRLKRKKIIKTKTRRADRRGTRHRGPGDENGRMRSSVRACVCARVGGWVDGWVARDHRLCRSVHRATVCASVCVCVCVCEDRSGGERRRAECCAEQSRDKPSEAERRERSAASKTRTATEIGREEIRREGVPAGVWHRGVAACPHPKEQTQSLH